MTTPAFDHVIAHGSFTPVSSGHSCIQIWRDPGDLPPDMLGPGEIVTLRGPRSRVGRPPRRPPITEQRSGGLNESPSRQQRDSVHPVIRCPILRAD